MTTNEEIENTQFATFERLDEFESGLKGFLSLDLYEDPNEDEEEAELLMFQRLTLILDEYQEQSYLLDPFLERLVVPTMEKFKGYIVAFVNDPNRRGSSDRVVRLSTVLYWFIKSRGAKTVVRFFPHQIEDLSAALTYLLLPTSYATVIENWHIRYCLLLWLSLVIMIPFDLARFDPDDASKSGETFRNLEKAGKDNLGRAGLEREGAAILLAKLYSRKDSSHGFEAFLSWTDEQQRTEIPDPFLAIGVLQMLCEMTKTGGSLKASDLEYIKSFNKSIEVKGRLSANTLVRKWRTKLTSRLALCSLPNKIATVARKQLMGNIPSATSQTKMNLDSEIPDDIEEIIESLLSALQDRDTTVRWSAAKGLARVAERLPKDFSDQVLESIMELFSIHLNDVGGVMADLQPAAEPTWHGALLACAEISRRGLVSKTNLPVLVSWLQKGLYFDVRKGAHSIGSSVRDATAYVLWALARAHDIESLRPFALDLARQLVTVAVFDREVHIRRATSAAFQENVGRTGLYPHGIDVVRKADFYAVGIRRNAFVTAAPAVAEHVEYRSFLLDHLLTITLKHWDHFMRQQGSKALGEICKINLLEDGPTCASRAAKLLSSPDLVDVHGGMVALGELAMVYKESQRLEEKRLEIFQYITALPQSTFNRYQNELILEASCTAIANSISTSALSLPSSGVKTPWRSIVDLGLKHKTPEVQYAAANAMGVVSRMVDCTDDVKKWTKDFKGAQATVQQSLSRTLGMLGYRPYPEGVVSAIQCLLNAVDLKSVGYSPNVETRQNCFHSLTKILRELDSDIAKYLTPQLINAIFNSFQRGLEDYTSDPRGDVGSWIRAQCIRSFVASSILLFTLFPKDLGNWVDAQTYHEIIGGVLKQAAERLDHIRTVAGTELCKLVQGWKESGAGEEWRLKGDDVFQREFITTAMENQNLAWGEGWLPPKVVNTLKLAQGWKESEVGEEGKSKEGNIFHREFTKTAIQDQNWGEGSWLFPRIVKILEFEEYRTSLLTGIVLSIGSRSEGTNKHASNALTAYAMSLPLSPTSTSTFTLLNFLQSIISLAQKNVTYNNLFVPILHTFHALLEGGVLARLSEEQDQEQGKELLKTILMLGGRNVEKLKSVPRISASMQLVISFLSLPSMKTEVVNILPQFLGHKFPTLRSSAAETIYLALQLVDFEADPEVEEILLETVWSADLDDELKGKIEKLATLLQEAE